MGKMDKKIKPGLLLRTAWVTWRLVFKRMEVIRKLGPKRIVNQRIGVAKVHIPRIHGAGVRGSYTGTNAGSFQLASFAQVPAAQASRRRALQRSRQPAVIACLKTGVSDWSMRSRLAT